MARIDAHQHFWKYDPAEYDWIDAQMGVLKRDFLPEHLAPLLSGMDLDGCVAVQARQSEAETHFLLELAQANPIIRGVVGWLDLQADELEERLEAFRPFGALKGIRHIVQAEPDPEFLLHPAFINGVRQLGTAGLTYDILVFERQLPAVVRFLEQCPDQPMVLDHIGKPVIEDGPSDAWTECIHQIAAHPNVYCKISGLVTEANWHQWTLSDFLPFLDVVADAFGPYRLMIGSDWPVCLLAAKDYNSVLEIAEYFFKNWNAAERAAIWGSTAAAFYKL